MTAAHVTPPRLSSSLSYSQCRAYENLAMAVVKGTVAEYISHNTSSGTEASARRLDTRRWKLLKKRRNIKIYKTREKFQPDVFIDMTASTFNAPKPAKWAPHSRLLCVGTLAGTMEDAMLGTVTPSELAMTTRSMVIKDEFIQHSVLQDIKVPTKEEPFEYVGLKWGLRSSALRSIVRKRDLVYVEASGYQYIPLNGAHEKIGYTVCHSVEIPELVPATSADAVRGKYSMCSVFRQITPDQVDVFVTLATDPGGNLPFKLAALSAAGALIAAAKVMDCALERKLTWMLKSNYTTAVSPDGSPLAVAKAQGSHWCCLQCTRNLSSFSSLSTCGICHSTVCFRCLTPHKLIVGSTAREVTKNLFQVCAGCFATAQRSLDITQVAGEEFAHEESAHEDETIGTDCKTLDSEIDMLTDTSSFMSRKNTRSPLPYDASSFRSRRNTRSPKPHHAEPIVLYDKTSVSPDARVTPRHSYIETEEFRMTKPLESRATARPSHMETEKFRTTKPLEMDDLAILDEQTTEEEDDEFIQTAEPLTASEVQRLQLLEQMEELRVQAEQTFRMTKRQTRTLQRSKLDVDERHSRRALSKSAIY